MNTKSFLVCFIVVMLATSIAMAGTHHGNFAPARGGFVRNGTGSFHGGNWNGGNWSRGHWNGGNWGGNWHHHNGNNVIFIGDFGFPWGWGWGYPYGYGYGYGDPYGYGYGDPYGYGYGYGYGGNQYGDYGYGNGSGYGDSSHSRVAELQRRLARAGYYRGSIDGVLGPQTRRAIRAYEQDHGNVG